MRAYLDIVKNVLEKMNLLSDQTNPTHEFFVTDAPERVYEVAGRFFGSELKDKIKKVVLP